MEWRARPVEQSDLDQVTTIWFDGWHEAHAAILPEALTRLRTRESFRSRLLAEFDAVRVIGEPGAPLAFAMIRGTELYQFYVAPSARGSGVATALMRDVEAQMAARRVDVAWLACAIGNARAARFYEKCGWSRIGVVDIESETPAGPYSLQVWRYEKRLTP